MRVVKLICDPTLFQAVDTPLVRWLDWESDYETAQGFTPPEFAMSRDEWLGCRQQGYRFCGLFLNGVMVAGAAELRFSDDDWTLAAVRTLEDRRGLGYGRQVSSFVTASILDAGRIPTCATLETNLPMIRTAQSLGYKICGP